MTAIEAKVVLLGATNVGKTCIVTRATSDMFDQDQASTVGASFSAKTIQTSNARVTLRIWDTAGQERFRSLAPMYYQGSQAALIVFSIADRDTFDAAVDWYDEVKSHFEKKILIYLIGNKSDLADQRAVSMDEINQRADEFGAVYFESSAKNGQNINEIFEHIAENIQEIDLKDDKDDVDLNETELKESDKKCC